MKNTIKLCALLWAITTTSAYCQGADTPPELTPAELVISKNNRTSYKNFKEDDIRPASATDDPQDRVEIHFQDADLKNILEWVSRVFRVSFLTEDALTPPPGKHSVSGKKITFKTQIALTKKRAWDLFITFLDLWGLTVNASSVPMVYQIQPKKEDDPMAITRSALPSFINTAWQELPDNDVFIRYVYIVQNAPLAAVWKIVTEFRSTAATAQTLPELDAFVITDKSSNIRSLMYVVDAFDQKTMPEQISVIKLKNAGALEVANLYKTLTQAEDPKSIAARLFGTKKAPSKTYFPTTAQVIPDPRTNSLFLLGDRESINKIEDFISTWVDIELETPYSPLYVYELQYGSADDIVKILREVTKFGQDSSDPDIKNAALYGGVRGGDKYFQPMTFEAETAGNRIVIRAEKEDYLKVREIIEQLDVEQPQVAVEVLIVQVTSADDRQLGIQMRNKVPGTPFAHANFQNSGLPLQFDGQAAPVVVPSGPNAGSLLGNLVTLAASEDPGSLLISIGNEATGGVWGIFKALQNYAATRIISNPFLVATNKYEAQISTGETRRLVTSTVVANETVEGFGDVTANLTVRVVPQINTDGIINLVIKFQLDVFTGPATSDPTNAQANGTRSTHNITTNANVANGEVLAFGGITRSVLTDTLSKVPILGDIPLLGWFFKNKLKSTDKDNILVFVSPHLIKTNKKGGAGPYSQGKINESRDTVCNFYPTVQNRDPIHRWFFNDQICEEQCMIDDFTYQNEPAPGSVAVMQKAIDDMPVKTETGMPQRQVNIHNIAEPQEDADLKNITAAPLTTMNNSIRKKKKKKESLANFMPANTDKEKVTV